MATTYIPLATTAISSTVTEVVFSGISSAYTDLILVLAPTAGGIADTAIQFNSDTGANYSRTYLTGNGTAASSGRNSSDTRIRLTFNGITGGSAGMQIIQIMNYANTTTNKIIINRNSNANYGTDANVGLWRSTSAITSVRVYCDGGGNWTAGNVSLYGVAAASVGAKATGGMISSDANYWYHTFTSSGTFTPSQALTCDVLVVAGGGGGGYLPSGYTNRASGGGGAGGLLGFTSQSLTTTNYSVTIGAGGSGANDNTNGSNSQFGALTASVGGGFGGVPGTKNANSGGSGGGGADNNNPAAGTSGQGFTGAGGFDPGSGSSYAGGGGGGATAAGSAGAANNGGAGGAGSSVYSTWINPGLNNIFATGGRGGSSATGSSSLNALANTGNGGIGSAINQNTAGGNGGSGLVIVRYPI